MPLTCLDIISYQLEDSRREFRVRWPLRIQWLRIMAEDNGWGQWLRTMAEDNGWGQWLGTMAEDNGWGQWLGTMSEYNG